MIFRRHIILAALAVGWLLAGTPAHAQCDERTPGACTYKAMPSETKADDKKADKATSKRDTRRRGHRVSRRYSRHRSAYRSGRRLARTTRHSRNRQITRMRGSIRAGEDDDGRASATTREESPAERTVAADDLTVGVLPQAMENGTSLSPVPETALASALRLPFGLASAQAQPVLAQEGAADTAPVRVAEAGGQRAPAIDMQQASATVGQAMRSPPEQSDTLLLRAMFLTLAGALVLATAVRLVVG